MKRLIITAVVAVLVGLVGQDDVNVQSRHEQIYCQMVAEGVWGAYDPEIECK